MKLNAPKIEKLLDRLRYLSYGLGGLTATTSKETVDDASECIKFLASIVSDSKTYVDKLHNIKNYVGPDYII